MKKEFTKEQIIAFGQRLANANLIVKYPARSHSHNPFSLFPQTIAQYNWLRRYCGTTSNVIIFKKREDVLKVVPELSEYIRPTKSGEMCRVYLSL